MYHLQVFLKAAARSILICVLGFALAGPAFADDAQKPNGVTGLKLKKGKGRVLVIAGVIPDTPAALVGLRVGDKIVAIDEKPLKKMSGKKAVSMFKGAPGTKLQLTIKRGKAEFDIILKRAKPEPPPEPVKTSSTSAPAKTSTTAKANSAQ